MEDKVASEYKMWLDKLNEPAPEGVWNSIADQMDIDQAWVGISEELDLIDVWKNLETELPKEGVLAHSRNTKTKFEKYFWLAAALILLTLTTPINEGAKYSQERVPSANNIGSSNDRLQESANAITDTIHGTLKQEIGNIIPYSTTSHTNNDFIVNKSVDHHKNLSGKNVQQSGRSIADSPFTSQPISRLYNEKKLKLTPIAKGNRIQADSIESSRALEPELTTSTTDKKDSMYNRAHRPVNWRFGVIGSINNTWLINSETSNGLKRTSLAHTKLTFGKEFGVMLERSIRERSFLQAEYYFYSEVGQHYEEYIDALFQNKNIRLVYHKFQLAYGRKLFKSNSELSPNILGGIYASNLKVADQTIGSENGNVTNEYNPWDYGMFLGGEIELSLSKNLVIAPGIRATYGFQNIFNGNTQSPSQFKQTNTATVGFSISIKYQN